MGQFYVATCIIFVIFVVEENNVFDVLKVVKYCGMTMYWASCSYVFCYILNGVNIVSYDLNILCLGIGTVEHVHVYVYA